ncbi:MAG: excinuclease ABC subunit UvrC [Gammaproteobacteria bacterium]|nr:excinuclease ABC subunit UvrC [Gammaproteobacteria bacterium]
MIPFNKDTSLKSITTRPGVYQMFDEQGLLLYVGKAANLRKRLATYLSNQIKDQKTQALLKHVVSIDIIVTRTENEALVIENNLIKKYHPKYNILFRDDKSYPYIFISSDDYPRIGLYRGLKTTHDQYFGPYPHARSVHETIQLIQKLFRIRTCNNAFFKSRSRPCLQYQIKRCSAPCVGLISKDDYACEIADTMKFLKGEYILDALEQKMTDAAQNLQYELAAKFRDQIRYLREIQAQQYVDIQYGDCDVVVAVLQNEMICIDLLMIRGGRVLGNQTYILRLKLHANLNEILTTFIIQHYLSEAQIIPPEILTHYKLDALSVLENILSKKAQKRVHIHDQVKGKKKKWIDMAVLNAQVTLQNKHNPVDYHEKFKAIEKLGIFGEPINSIACFDISHTQGEATVGSCVVFNTSGPAKELYRRFNIKDIPKGDDVAAMRQVLLRYFSRIDEKKLPNIVLIDGGKTQLTQARKVLTKLGLHQKVKLVGVAKDKTRKSGLEKLYVVDKNTPITLAKNSVALNLILQIRDEAHRFAISGHRKKRQKQMMRSPLDLISNIGSKRRKLLLKYFGGLEGLMNASVEDLTSVSGIGRKLAAQIYEALH